MKTDTKQPIIRPGQRKPYVKATRQQIDERRGYVARLLRAGKTKWQCDRYIAWLTHLKWEPEENWDSEF
jgi:hypothetical protein